MPPTFVVAVPTTTILPSCCTATARAVSCRPSKSAVSLPSPEKDGSSAPALSRQRGSRDSRPGRTARRDERDRDTVRARKDTTGIPPKGLKVESRGLFAGPWGRPALFQEGLPLVRPSRGRVLVPPSVAAFAGR